MSAQSLLLGMFPGASVGFVVDEDRGDEDDGDTSEAALERGRIAKLAAQLRMSSSLSVCLSVKESTPLLHGFKENPVFKKLKEEALAKGMFVEWAAKPVCGARACLPLASCFPTVVIQPLASCFPTVVIQPLASCFPTVAMQLLASCFPTVVMQPHASCFPTAVIQPLTPCFPTEVMQPLAFQP
jgi:hypothetical protein